MAKVPPEYYYPYAMNSDLQTQNIDAQMSQQVPNMLQQQQAVQAAIIEQTNPDRVLRDIELRLKGKEERADGTIQKVSEPLMNDLGIGRIRSLLSSVINQNTILSYLEMDEIGRIMIKLGDDIGDSLEINWKEFGINDKTILDHIVDICLIPTFMTLKRAYKQNEKNWLNKAVIENINTSPRMMPQKKEGFFSRFKI